MTDYHSIAASLYDGGWRAEDLDDIAREYDFSQVGASEICEYLVDMQGMYENGHDNDDKERTMTHND